MEQNLLPIYALRMMLLEKLNPTFFNKNKKMILGSSLAAQDYYLSGKYYEYDRRSGHMFMTMPDYIEVHHKYGLPYNPATSYRANNLNPGLVMDLANSLQTDKINGIINSDGSIKNIKTLPQSEVLKVYHNSSINGTPINALRTMTLSQIESMLVLLTKQKVKVH